MARTSSTAQDSPVLKSFEQKQFTSAGFTYQISRDVHGVSYSVSAGSQTVSEPLGWAVGTEKVGQTYLSVRDGIIYETPFSYFEMLRGFAITPGFDQVQLPNFAHEKLRSGLARPLSSEIGQGCFECHNTAVATSGRFDAGQMIANVTCEACHGPGANHAAAEKAGLDSASGLVFNPTNLNPADSVDFCGSCHSAWWDVMLSEKVGVETVLAPPYRLELSRCWGNGDARITCVACHNPHQPLSREPDSYDKNCMGCHATKSETEANTGHSQATCPVAQSGCVSCHMPKYEVPQMHYTFTDHMIRVVKAGEPFRD